MQSMNNHLSILTQIMSPLLSDQKHSIRSINNAFDLMFGSPRSLTVEEKYISYSDRVAVINISGFLINREFDQCSLASYEGIRKAISIALKNDDVDYIIGRFDSCGGSSSQMFDLSDYIYKSRGKGKRLIAMVDDVAYSAGFGIASAFDEIWITRSGAVGSVGVVQAHIDQSGFDKKIGIKVEYIYSGDRKIQGNPHGPLTDRARQDYKKEVMRLYGIFTATVARNLGITNESVKATEAAIYYGDQAITAGFAHRLGTFDQLIKFCTRGSDYA